MMYGMYNGRARRDNLDWLSHKPKQIVRRDTPQDHGYPEGYEWSKTQALEWVGTEAQYPQSLGELCLEMCQDAFLYRQVHGKPPTEMFTFYPSADDRPFLPAGLNLRVTLADIAALRRAMYHHHRT
jgi:hypothetical protein